MDTREQEVWLIDGNRVVLIYFANYPLAGEIRLASGERFERLGLDVYIRIGGNG